MLVHRWQIRIVAVACFAVIGLAASRGDKPMKEPEYEYREDLKPLVALTREDGDYFGHLDAGGNFVPLPGEKPRGPGSGPLIYNRRKKPDEVVYELRNGALIKGKLDDYCRFVPEVGSTVIAFKDYHYGKNAIRIYNLPGTFAEKTDPKKK